jgi:hypothetical protein
MQKTNHQTKELISETVKSNIVNSSAIILMLENLEIDDPISSLIQETLNEHIEAYTRKKKELLN